MKKLSILFVVMFVAATTLGATKHWNGTIDRDFTNWDNWSSTTVFTGTNDGAVSKAGSSSPIMYSSSTALSTSRKLYLGAGDYGEFEMQGSSVALGGFEIGGDYWISSGDDGAMTMSGGNFSTGGQTEIGRGNTGSLSISGGTFNVGSWLTIGGVGSRNGLAGSGSIDLMDNGSVIANRVYVGQHSGSTGSISLSGNSSFDVDTYIYIGASSATASVTVMDSATLNGENMSLRSGSSLNFVIDGTNTGSMANFSTTTASDNSLDGIVDVSFESSILPGTYDLIDFGADMTSTDISGLLSTSAANAGWNLDMVAGGSGSILQATYIPEPATLAILGLGGLSLLRRGKK